jgi:ABC-type uncharacterized transport system permease subunit
VGGRARGAGGRAADGAAARGGSIRFKADQVVVGIAINLLAIGLTRFFLNLVLRQLVQLAARGGLRREGSGTGIRRAAANPLVWMGVALVP